MCGRQQALPGCLYHHHHHHNHQSSAALPHLPPSPLVPPRPIHRTRGRRLLGILRCGFSTHCRSGGSSFALALVLEVHALHGANPRLSIVNNPLLCYGNHLLTGCWRRVIHGVVVLDHRAKTSKKEGHANWKPRGRASFPMSPDFEVSDFAPQMP